MTFAGNYQGPLYAPHPDIKKMNREQLDQFKANYASLIVEGMDCLLYTSPSPRDGLLSRMPSSA